MFIRRTKTRTVGTQDHYFTFRLVKSVRLGDKVRQRTLLNLGAHFDLRPAQWPLLCQRLDDLLAGQATLMDYPEAVEDHAQRIVAQLISRQAETNIDADDTSSAGDLHRVDVDSLQLVRPRTVGVEHVGLWAMQQVGLPALLAQLGLNSRPTGSAMASIIGRLAAPGSERATHRWLRDTSALGDLLDVDFENYSLMQLYRASDALMVHRKAIEEHLFDAAMTLFDLQPTVTLYDLTNTYFEGDARLPRRKHNAVIPRRNAVIVRYSHWVSCWMPAALYGALKCLLATSASRTRWPRCSLHCRLQRVLWW